MANWYQLMCYREDNRTHLILKARKPIRIKNWKRESGPQWWKLEEQLYVKSSFVSQHRKDSSKRTFIQGEVMCEKQDQQVVWFGCKVGKYIRGNRKERNMIHNVTWKTRLTSGSVFVHQICLGVLGKTKLVWLMIEE